MAIKSVARGLVRSVLRGVTNPIKRIFVDLNGTNASHLLSSFWVAAGDFDIEFEFTKETDATIVLLGKSTATSDFIASFPGNSFQFRLNGGSLPAIVFTNADDGKLHKIRYKRTGNSIQTFFDDVLKATDTNTNTLTVDQIGRNISGLLWKGVIANAKLVDLSTANNTFTFLLNQETVSTETALEGGKTVTYVNVATEDRQIYTKERDDFLGVDLVVNGVFNSDTIWTKATEWTISGGKALLNTTSVSRAILQTPIGTVGRVYKTSYEVLDYVSGDIIITLGVGSDGSTRSSNGVFTEILPPSTTSIIQLFNLTAISQYSVDNVSVKRILEVA